MVRQLQDVRRQVRTPGQERRLARRLEIPGQQDPASADRHAQHERAVVAAEPARPRRRPQHLDRQVTEPPDRVTGRDFADGDADIDTTQGDVGIGVTNPASRLHLRDDVNTSMGIIIENTSTGPFASGGIFFGPNRSNEAGIAAFVSLMAASNLVQCP